MKKFIKPNWRQLRDLSDELQKCFFYCWDKADAAGVYEYDTLYMNADLGFVLQFDELLKLPGAKKISDTKFLFSDYLQVSDNGIIKAGYNPHKPIFRAIEQHGAEHFADLDIKVESGVKDDKKIQAIKIYFKLENLFFKLVSESESRSESESESLKGGVGENISENILEIALPPNVLEAAEMNQFDFTKNRNTDFVKSQWQIFLKERMHDPPTRQRQFTRDPPELYKYFLNWIRNKFPKNGKDKQHGSHKLGHALAEIKSDRGFGSL